MGKAVMSVDTNTKAYTKVMSVIAKASIPIAVAEALNQTADAVTNKQISIVKKKFTIRSKYTLKSMQAPGARPYHALNKARGKDIQKMFSRAGTKSPYLWKQDQGGTFGSESGGPVPIATKAARMSKSLNKSISKRHRLSPGDDLSADGPFYGASGYQRHFIGNPKGGERSLGLYERSANNKKLTMIRNLESEEINIEPTHFHSDPVKKYGTGQFIAAQYKKAAEKEIKKAVNHGV